MAQHIASSGRQLAQRVTVGLVGLAAVILLIALASAIFKLANKEQLARTDGASSADVAANIVVLNDSDAAKEPLAEIGVTPSAATDPVDASIAANTIAPASGAVPRP